MNKKRYIFWKRIFDVVFAFIVFITRLSWLTPLLALIIYLESGDKTFFKQIRIGKKGMPFTIYKFKSMTGPAPENDPLLSVSESARITKTGKFIRKYRIDEMSIIGPRPERQFFLYDMIAYIPKYKELLNLKPGISSIGQIKFGYADNLEQMLKRVRYDLIYLNNLNFWTDIKIILSTKVVVFQGKGR